MQKIFKKNVALLFFKKRKQKITKIKCNTVIDQIDQVFFYFFFNQKKIGGWD